jgi:hypothetical protein
MISDDELLLYYYRDGLEASDRERIGAALSREPELARRLHALVARLDSVAASPDVPVPEHTRQRWQAALANQVRKSQAATARRPFHLQMNWQLAAAAVAVVALGVTLQQTLRTSPDDVNVVAVTPPPAPAKDASPYENGLKFHLASTERRLASLKDASPEERARLVDAIIGQNRIYALAAERAGEPQLARVLRAFTPILQEVSAGHAEMTASSLAQLNFELRVMQARLGAEAQPPATL